MRCLLGVAQALAPLLPPHQKASHFRPVAVSSLSSCGATRGQITCRWVHGTVWGHAAVRQLRRVQCCISHRRAGRAAVPSISCERTSATMRAYLLSGPGMQPLCGLPSRMAPVKCTTWQGSGKWGSAGLLASGWLAGPRKEALTLMPHPSQCSPRPGQAAAHAAV